MTNDICAEYTEGKCLKGLSVVQCSHICPERTPWIYESPDKGKTVYRRRFGDYDTPREKIKG